MSMSAIYISLSFSRRQSCKKIVIGFSEIGSFVVSLKGIQHALVRDIVHIRESTVDKLVSPCWASSSVFQVSILLQRNFQLTLVKVSYHNYIGVFESVFHFNNQLLYIAEACRCSGLR